MADAFLCERSDGQVPVGQPALASFGLFSAPPADDAAPFLDERWTEMLRNLRDRLTLAPAEFNRRWWYSVVALRMTEHLDQPSNGEPPLSDYALLLLARQPDAEFHVNENQLDELLLR